MIFIKAVVFGEIIWDVYPEEKVIGGAPFNFSAHLAKLENEVILISAVGNDENGEKTLQIAKNYGISTDMILRNGFETGKCLVSLSGDGIPSYNVLRNTAYDNIEITEKEIDKINSVCADVFYFNTLIQREETSRNSLKKILKNCNFKEIFSDINLRENCFDENSLRLCLEESTIVKISDEEAHFLYELEIIKQSDKSFPQAVADAFPNLKYIVYTLGGDGSQVLDTGNGILYQSEKPERVEIVSTVGAGDCYGASFASVILNGGTIPEAIDFAAKRSSIVVAHREAVPF